MIEQPSIADWLDQNPESLLAQHIAKTPLGDVVYYRWVESELAYVPMYIE